MLKPALRERLLGALVFLCLGLIFYPAIFDTRNEFVVDRQTQIPTQLIRVEPLALETPVIPEQSAPRPVADEMFMPEEPSVPSGGDQAGILDESGIPNAWVLQAGSFAERNNALEVEQRLLAAGYRAYTRQTAAADDSPRYRVLVGPYLDRGIALSDSNAMVEASLGTPLLLEFSP